jgi:copper chaperone CopZ
VSVAVKKLEGVESIDVSLEKSSAVIVLKPDNKLTLPQLRRVIRNAGYPTKDAQVTAKGAVLDRNGKPVLDLLNGSALELTEMPKGAPAGPVEIVGVSRLVARDVERLTIDSIKK